MKGVKKNIFIHILRNRRTTVKCVTNNSVRDVILNRAHRTRPKFDLTVGNLGTNYHLPSTAREEKKDLKV